MLSIFVEHLLVKQLGVKHLIIGDDFRFGNNRQGNFAMLQKAGEKFGFGVTDTKSYKMADCRISSTEIRKALQLDQLAVAEQMLGRKYSIIGRVVHGDKQGRDLGFSNGKRITKALRFSCVRGLRGAY